MTKYEDLPSALGASIGQTTVKHCDYCGEIFPTIFDEADHMLEENEDSFDPYYPLSDGSAIRLGNLLRTFYDNADDAEAVRELSEEIYSVLLLAEYKPDTLDHELDLMLND